MNAFRQTIAVDANPLLSALRGGRAESVLLSDKFIFVTTEHTTWEVKKYIPEISAKSGVPESELFYMLNCYPIISIPPFIYDEKRQQAEALIANRDPKDVDILALTLKWNIPLWTNDHDFDNIQQITTFTTAEILAQIAALVS